MKNFTTREIMLELKDRQDFYERRAIGCAPASPGLSMDYMHLAETLEKMLKIYNKYYQIYKEELTNEEKS